MDFKQTIRVIRRQWIPVVVTILAGILAAIAYVAVAPAQYTTQTKLLLEPTGGTGTAQELVAGNNLLVQQVGTFTQLASTPVVLQPVIDELGLDTTADKLADKVSVASVGLSALIAIEATADTPEGAVDLGNAVAASLSDQIESSGSSTSPAAISVSVVQEPVAPASPSSPNTILAILIGLFGGLAVAFIIVVLAELLNTRVRNGRDIAKATDAAYLGRVPAERSLSRKPVPSLTAPSGRFAEAVRIIRTKVVASISASTAPVVVISSPGLGDGKSTIAANLAVALAEGGLQVALIDGDLRSPSTARLFGIRSKAGLSNALLAGVAPESITRSEVATGLTVITTDAVEAGTSDVLSSERTNAVITALAADVDIVILDAGPLLANSDGLALSEVADGYVVVARAGRTRADELRQAVDSLEDVGAEVYGVVLTAAPVRGADARD
ncbi:polysaccharide biosynthesis tyrosine autokinase [Orlajensenia leifsoniae]|uniref:Polysaccharide chain length determinant N-terminal domain-containing protein n=1 Tax=Orlajensenia leifsoniae TaxID=2561933 RepID=A0A4Y9QY42_9MICO|nr:polysaccharide biosynthesis tyrosine autokinase [Leifsonia flava]TFV96980.1 hypothetical protein E4M00_13060 [Leifsonia flava]